MTHPGRPFGTKSRKPRKDVRLTISFTPEEMAIIEAARGNIIKGVWIRRAALRYAEEWRK